MKAAQKKANLEVKLGAEKVAVAQKKQDFQKSVTQHTDYPSVLETQQRYRDKHEKEWARLQEEYKVALADYNKATEQIAGSLTRALPLEMEALVQRYLQGQAQKNPTGIDEAKIQALEASFEKRFSEQDRSIESKIRKPHDNQSDRALAETELASVIQMKTAEVEQKVTEDFENKFAAQQKVIDGLLESHNRLAAQFAKAQTEKATAIPTPAGSPVEQDDGELRARMNKLETRQKENREQQEKHNKSLHTDVSKIRLETTRLDKDLEYLRTTVARQDEVKELRIKSSELTTELIKLSTGLNQMKIENEAKGTLYEDYAEMTTKHQVQIPKLEASTEELEDRLAQLDRETRGNVEEISRLKKTTKGHQEELSRLDLNTLEAIAEGWVIDWPNIKDSVGDIVGLRQRVEKLENISQTASEVKDRGRQTPSHAAQARDSASRQGSVASRSEKGDGSPQDLKLRVMALENKLNRAHEFENSGLHTIADLQGKLAKRVREVETRLAKLPTQTPQQTSLIPELSNLTSNVNRLSTDFQIMRDMINLWTERVKNVEFRNDELLQRSAARNLLPSDPEVTEFKTKVAKVEGDFERLSTDLQGVSSNFEFLGHQVKVLDSQFNNITTRPLAEHIIAHMEQIYPTNREILADLEKLHQRVSSLESDARTAMANQEFRLRARPALGGQNASFQAGGVLTSVAGNKRRRTDDGINGSPRPAPADVPSPELGGAPA